MTDRTVFRTCPLCEATCGLEIEIKDGAVKRIRGDRDDVFSHGFICPKGSTLKQLHDDPDRLRKPVVRRGFDDNGAPIFEEVEWDEAYREADRVLREVRDAHGNESVGVYLGNPGAHVLAASTHSRHLIKAVGGGAVFSASTVDQMPRHVASGYLYGSGGSMPVPDIDRTDLFICMGANPYASNGSIATAPDFPGRIEAVQERGGRVIVIDPRRSRTAEQADQHISIKPGTDGVLLAAVVRRLLAQGAAADARIASMLDGVDELRTAVEPFTSELATAATGVAATTIDALADEIAAANSAAVYGRIGVCTVEFGTLTTWLLDVISILTGNLDEPGGMMFPEPSHDRVRAERPGRPYRVGRRHSRVNGRPEIQGEFPVADLPDEILTEGDGQLRMMFTVAGNPVLSCPDGERMDEAFAALDAMISVDIYFNETTRHASVVFPPPGSLEKSHYDINFTNLSIRNVANYSPAVFEADGPPEEDILAKLALIALGFGPDADPNDLHDQVLAGLLQAEIDTEVSPVAGRDLDELLSMVDGDTGSERLLDAMLRTGARGDGFGSNDGGLSLALLRDNPHGIDFGALEPRLPGLLRTPEKRVDLFAGPFADDLTRLSERLPEWAADERLRLVGRRHLRSNNSWMHNLQVLVKGKPRCTLQLHPDNAADLGLTDGDAATIRSRVGEVTAPVEVTDSIMPGVVSLPHGWGHSKPGAKMSVAAEHAGVNSNVLTDPTMIDPLSGNAVLNGIPVDVIPA
jgi:anaerobic selenocysteine-containing dehydrogenase